MKRYCAGLTVAMLMLASDAQASFDLFSTQPYVASGAFARTTDVCDTEKIRRPLALADIVDLSLCNNPQTRTLWANSRVQAAQLGVSLSSYLPTLSGPISVSSSQSQANGIVTPNNQKNVGITVSYLLYDFGGRAANVENARQLLVAANAVRDATLQTTYLNAVEAYYALLLARESVQSFRAAETDAQNAYYLARTRCKLGLAPLADSLQAQTALSQATLNRIQAEGNAASAQGMLANTMGYDANQPFEVEAVAESRPDPVIEQDIGQLVEQARRNRPDMLAADAQVRAAEANVTSVKASGLPTFSLNGGYARTYFQSAGTSQADKSLSVSVSMPWFSGYRDTYNNRAAVAQMEGKAASRDSTAIQVSLDVWKAYQMLLTNSQMLRAAEELLKNAKEAEDSTLERYRQGSGSILEVIDAERALSDARQQHLAALYGFKASRFILAQAMGELDMTYAPARK
jgi:outer membrane protein